MKADKDALARIVAGLKAKKKRKMAPRARPEIPVDLDLLEKLRKVNPQLVHDLAARMGITRNGIYWMLRKSYGGTKESKEAINKLNGILKQMYLEIREHLNMGTRKGE